MKKIISLMIAGIMCQSLCSFNVMAEEEKICLYVEAGAENGDGTFNSPLGSLEEARDKVREIKENGYPKDGICVYFREGIYQVTNSVKFNEEDSGTKEAPVVYRAYGNDNVRFIGGVEIDLSDFKNVSDEYGKAALQKGVISKVLSVPLSDYGINDVGELDYRGHGMYYVSQIEQYKELNRMPAPELIFNDVAMTLARYPNDGFMTISGVPEEGTDIMVHLNAGETSEPVPPTISGGGEKLKDWVNAKEPWVFGYWKHDWSDMTMRVAEIDAQAGTFTTDIPSAYLPKQGQRFYAYNLLEELDTPGEYYIDRDTNILYFYPPQSSGKITLTLVAPAFLNILGADNLAFKSISFEGSRENGIYMNKCDNITIENCIVDKVQKVGIFGESQCTNITLSGNHIKNAGSSAINLVGGDILTDTPSGNVVINNWIHHFGRVTKTYCYGVMVRGYKTRVAHNKIHDCPHTALGFSGNEHIIEYNEIFNALKNTDDMGAIYTGRTKLDQGTVIRHNYIHDLITDSSNSAGIFGIYLDDMQDGITVESNVFENIQGSAVFINGGRVNKVDSNVVINAGEANFRISLAGLNLWGGDINRLINEFPGMNDGTYKTEPYTRYEHLKEIMEDEPLYTKYNEITNNVAVGTASDIFYDLWGKQDKQVVIERNNIEQTQQYKKDPGFVDFERGNYTIKEDSELMQLEGFKAPEFEKMGLLTEWLSYKMQDTISLKVNSPVTAEGFEHTYIDIENTEVTPIIVNDLTYVPIRYLAEALGGDVEFIEEERKADISVSDKKISISLDTMEITVNGEVLADNTAIVRNDRTLVPLRALSELVLKNVEWHDCGVIIVSDKEKVLDSEGDKALVELLDSRLSNI